jgi:polysaccharide export outer membrane protein
MKTPTQTLNHVFLLDDDPHCLAMYERHIRNLGVKEVTVFEDSQDFINQLMQEPDAVIIDHSMEPFDGLEVLKKIKRQNPDIPVVYLSAQKDMKTAVDALKFGAFDYIIKDENDLDHLTEVIGRLSNFLREVQLRRKRSFTGILSSITKMF